MDHRAVGQKLRALKSGCSTTAYLSEPSGSLRVLVFELVQFGLYAASRPRGHANAAGHDCPIDGGLGRKTEIIPESETDYFIEFLNREYHFVKDESGTIVALEFGADRSKRARKLD